jgi:hypothetical protein
MSALIELAEGSLVEAVARACRAKATWPPAESFLRAAARGPAFLLVRFL